MPVQSRIEVEGLDEFNRAVRRAADRDLGRRMGQANKSIGALVISKLDPTPDASAVGAGAGAKVRPSASKRDVILRAGGAHRAHSNPQITKMRQWGKRQVAAFQSRPPRPHILQTALTHRDEIEQAWLEAVSKALDPAFHKTDP